MAKILFLFEGKYNDEDSVNEKNVKPVKKDDREDIEELLKKKEGAIDTRPNSVVEKQKLKKLGKERAPKARKSREEKCQDGEIYCKRTSECVEPISFAKEHKIKNFAEVQRYCSRTNEEAGIALRVVESITKEDNLPKTEESKKMAKIALQKAKKRVADAENKLHLMVQNKQQYLKEMKNKANLGAAMIKTKNFVEKLRKEYHVAKETHNKLEDYLSKKFGAQFVKEAESDKVVERMEGEKPKKEGKKELKEEN